MTLPDDPSQTNAKPWYRSWTFWTNVLLPVAVAAEPDAEKLAVAHPQAGLAVLAVVNIFLRLFKTNGPVTF